jgi:DNA mismatch repair protein MutS2
MNKTLLDKSAQVLEWPRLLEALALLAQSSMGARRCRSLLLSTDLATAEQRQQETTEMVRLVAGSDPMPALSFPDVREVLARAEKGGSLDAQDLRDCGLVLHLLDETAHYLLRHEGANPSLARMAEPLRSARVLRPVMHAVDSAIQPDGSVKESATPELRRLTRHAIGLKQQMRDQLEQMLQSRRFAGVLQESYFAQREGRYVVPVKSDMRGRIPGIVHDVSASGATVFLEPRELVDLNNAIKVADLEIEREVRRILQELTLLIAAHTKILLAGVETLAELDCIRAKAELSRRLEANPVSLNDCGRILLKQARHPLLMLTRDVVVPNDILLNEGVQVLVVSGPNTGGKTVTLKIVGLYALMVRGGLHLPCASESDMAVFAECYADIGDAQDLSRDLSSFSAHMTQMVQLLSEADVGPAQSDSRRSPPLLLLDEPVTSTDPQEGAALAEALLCHLAARGMKVVVTTHYGPLKALAQTTPGFANASVAFDVAQLAPTFRLILGIPGGSSALEIAGRLGMDERIVQDARRRLRQDDRRLEALMADLHAKQLHMDQECAQATQARKEAEAASGEARALLARLEETEQETRKGLKKKLGEQFQRAKAEVQSTVDALKREQKLIKAKETKQRLVALEQQTGAELAPAREPIPLRELSTGDTVEIAGLAMTGVLLEVPQGKKRVRVKVGEGEVLATVANLVGLSKRAGDEAHAASSPAEGHRASGRTSFTGEEQDVIDVRGQAADDAIDHVIAALDRATLAGAPFLRIIHGHGTGKLKASLREYLKASPYVAEFRPGDRAEGGDGVTVVVLR